MKCRVEIQDEMIRGELTGRVVYHVSEDYRGESQFRGCPLGRGSTEQSAIVDFVRRGASEFLGDGQLTIGAVEIVSRWDLRRNK